MEILKPKHTTSEIKSLLGWDTVTHACITALWEAKAGGSLEVRSLRPAYPKW